MEVRLTAPADPEEVRKLRAGDVVLITGTMYTARDAAHKRLCDLLKEGKELPVDLRNAVLYYTGPTPAPPGRAVGSAGPTSSYRMDAYTEPLLEKGLKVMIGKGPRDPAVKELLKRYGAVYLSAVGGTGALISETIEKCETVAYPDLGAEAVHRLETRDFFAVVTYDSAGNDLLAEGTEKYRKRRTGDRPSAKH